SAYDPRWIIDNQMGPHPLWLMEWLCEAFDLPARARVLDLGCGKALTSIFLAREFGGLRAARRDRRHRPAGAGRGDRRRRGAGAPAALLEPRLVDLPLPALV